MKTINIHGKEYVEVSERVKEFHKLYPDGFITTAIEKLDKDIVVIKATVYPTVENVLRYFIGHAYERENSSQVNQTSYIENCETSAVGRALGFLGIGVIDGIASADEVQNAVQKQKPVNNDDLTKQAELSNYLTEMTQGDSELAQDMLQEMSGFTNKTGKYIKGKKHCSELTGKWLDITLRKAKEQFEAQQGTSRPISDEEAPF